MTYKSVLVTGANRGIGLEFIRQFAAQQDLPKFIFAACRDPQNAKELNTIAAKDKRVHIMKLDLNDESTFTTAAGQVKDIVKEDGLNLLINNAGIANHSGLSDITSQEMLDSYRVNSIGPLMVTKAFLPLLKQSSSAKNRTCVVNISSGYGSMSFTISKNSIFYAYGSSKAAMNSLTVTLAIDLRGDDIIVICMSPGWVRTDMGGANADISPTESVTGLLKTINNLSMDQTGSCYNRYGETMPW